MAGLPLEVTQMIQTIWPIALMALIFYFLLYRPQKKEQTKRANMLNSLKKGDRVVTIGGIHGTIIAMTDKVITLKVAEKVEIDVSRSAIGGQQNA